MGGIGVGVGVAVGGTGVGVGGSGVGVGGTGVAVDGTGVSVAVGSGLDVGVGGTGVDVDVLVGGTGVSVGTGVGGTGVGVRVSNGSAVGSGSSEEQALNPIAATTTTAVKAATAMKKMPARDSREGRVPNDFNAVIKSQRLARAVSRYDESRQPLSTESMLYRAIEHQHPFRFLNYDCCDFSVMNCDVTGGKLI